MLMIKTIEKNFKNEFDKLLQRGKMDIENVSKIVKEIMDEIKEDGNSAVKNQIERFDGWSPKEDVELQISTEDMKKAYNLLNKDLKNALNLAYNRIKSYHEKLLPKTWMQEDETGSVLGQKITAVDRAGLYIPGGKAAYPSSLLMNAIPAIVAGVEEIVVCTPAPNGELNSLLLAAMHLCGIKKAYKIGGASAIATMAYGTQSIPKVDVVTGPGNIFVATAKKLVYGEVNIDMIAGPSEIGVLADSSADAKLLAIDLLSQAEHDEMASSILITTDEKLAKETQKEIENWLQTLDREKIARASIEKRGAVIITKNMDEAIALMNEIAPEHLEVMCEDAFAFLPKIKHAGAIFLGNYTPEPIGDYIAGPNHTLPTGGTAKFYSPLSVDNFIKKSSIISMSKIGIEQIGKECALLAKTEGLDAHAISVLQRL